MGIMFWLSEFKIILDFTIEGKIILDQNWSKHFALITKSYTENALSIVILTCLDYSWGTYFNATASVAMRHTTLILMSFSLTKLYFIL